MVVTFLPPTVDICVWQDLTALPSIWTVQAPHRPEPQPYLVPVSLRCSRTTQSRAVSGSASTLTALCDRRHGLPPWQTVHHASGIFRLNRRMVVVFRIGRKASSRGAAAWRGFPAIAGPFGAPATRERSMMPRRSRGIKGRIDDPMIGQSNFAGNIAYDDLREWLAMAERLGEGRTVKGANCEEEIGLAAEAGLRPRARPPRLF